MLVCAINGIAFGQVGELGKPAQTNIPDIFVVYENSPGVLDFGNVKVGKTASQNLRIGNVGTILEVTDILFSDSAFAASDTSFIVAIFSSENIDLLFTPWREGVFVDTVQVMSDDPDQPLIKIPVTGVGKLPEVTILDNDINFGSIVRGAFADSIRLPLLSSGEVPLSIFDISLGDTANSNVFTFSDTVLDVLPGDTANIFVKFNPFADTLFSDTLTILTDAKNISSPQLTISGSAISPEITIPLDSVDFGSVNFTTFAVRDLIVKNSGQADLVLDSLIIDTSSVFTVAGSLATIGPGDSALIQVEFRPNSDSLFVDSVLVFSSDPDVPQVVVYLQGIGVAPDIFIVNDSLLFGNVRAEDSLVIQDTLVNTGTDTLKIISTLTSSSFFTSNLLAGASLPPNDTLIFDVTFLPDSIRTFSDSLVIASNDPDDSTRSVFLSGNGIAPEILLSAQSFLFGDTTIGDTLTLPLTIFNIGNAVLSVDSIVTNTGAFAVSINSGLVNPSDSLNVSVFFVPVKNPKNFDTLTVYSDALSDPVISLSLQGNNLAPTITSLPDTVFNEGDQFTYAIAANDSDSNALTFSLKTGPPSMTIDSLSGLVKWTIGITDSGLFAVEVKVVDELAAADSQMFTINVASIINAPFFTTSPPLSHHVDSVYSYTFTTDSEGGPPTYSLLVFPSSPSKMTLADSTITWTPKLPGTFDVIVQAIDTLGMKSRQSFQIQVRPDVAPVFVTLPDSMVTEDIAYLDTIVAVDPENDVVRYSLVSAPVGYAIDSVSGAVSWLPTNANVGQATVVIQTKDQRNNKAQRQIGYTVINTNDPPQITGLNDTTIIEDKTVTLKFTVSDPDAGDTLIVSDNTDLFQATSLGILKFKAPNENVGANNISIIASDGTLSDTLSFVLTVSNTNDAPEFISRKDSIIFADVLAKILVQAIDVDGDSVTYSLLKSPPNAVIDPVTGIISWTPNEFTLGRQSFRVRVQDTFGAADTLVVSVSVIRANKAPQFFNIPKVSFLEDKSKKLFLSKLALDFDNDLNELSWQVFPGKKVSVVLNDSSIVLSAPENFSGIDTISVIVVDPDGLADTLVTQVIVIEVNDPPQITAISPATDTTVMVNDTLQFNFEASDIETPDLTTTWLVEDIPVSNKKAYTFIANEEVSNPSKLSLEVSDGIDTISVSWLVTVDIITDVSINSFTLNYLPFKGVELHWQFSSDDAGLVSFDIVREVLGTEEIINTLPVSSASNQSELIYIDKYHPNNATLYYLIATNPNGSKQKFGPLFIDKVVPDDFELSLAYPNPFNNSVTIPYSLPMPSDIILQIYSVQGRLVKTIGKGNLDAGFHFAKWDGTNSSGNIAASGWYLIVLRTPGKTLTNPILFIK